MVYYYVYLLNCIGAIKKIYFVGLFLTHKVMDVLSYVKWG